MVQSINLSIDYVPVKKYDYIKKHCADLFIENKQLQERIEELETENGKLNIILYHRENGLSHSDFNAEMEISKQAKRIKELERELLDVTEKPLKHPTQ